MTMRSGRDIEDVVVLAASSRPIKEFTLAVQNVEQYPALSRITNIDSGNGMLGPHR
jgi:hypothetical protein